jgi:hypothetical protein
MLPFRKTAIEKHAFPRAGVGIPAHGAPGLAAHARRVTTMTPKISTRNPLRLFAALLAGCLLLGALPAATALEVDDEDLEAPTIEGSCHAKSFRNGEGDITVNGNTYSASGGWTNGCGGNGCDDSVAGTIYSASGRAIAGFSVTENRSGGSCIVRCQIGSDAYYLNGHVSPSSDQVSFSCNGWFSGWLDWGVPTLTVIIGHSEPVGP